MSGNPDPKIVSATTDVWQRLSKQMAQVESLASGKSDSDGLKERLAGRAKQFRQRMESPNGDGSRFSFLAFSKQQERYGIPLDHVVAVESLEHFTPVPNSSDYIRGVMPWRGSILSLVDLGRMFGRRETGIADLKAAVIVETDGQRLAFVAYEVEEIFSVFESDLAPAPDLPGRISSDWIMGVHDENRLILRLPALFKGIATITSKASGHD